MLHFDFKSFFIFMTGAAGASALLTAFYAFPRSSSSEEWASSPILAEKAEASRVAEASTMYRAELRRLAVVVREREKAQRDYEEARSAIATGTYLSGAAAKSSDVWLRYVSPNAPPTYEAARSHINDSASPTLAARTPLKQYDAPFLPWPPLEPSSLGDVTDQFAESTYDKVNRRISDTLERVGFPRWWYFSVPGGFAVATQLERIDLQGRPAPDSVRWTNAKVPFVGGFRPYLRRLMQGDRTRFRMFVFIVTPHKLKTSPDAANDTDVRRWTTTGSRSLGEEISQLAFADSRVFLFVYEFAKARGRDAALAQDRSQMLPFHVHAASLKITQ